MLNLLKKMLNLLKKADKLIVKLCEICLIFTMIAMVLLVFWQVICRFIIHMSVPYAEEFARLAIVWCILLGGALAVRTNDHIRVDSLANIMPKIVQFLLWLFAYALMLIFEFVITKYSWDYTIVLAEDFTTSLGYCRNIFAVPGVVFGAIAGIYTIVNIVLLFYNEIKHTSVHLT